MALIRWFLGKIILFVDAVFSPTAPVRSIEEQKKMNSLVSNIELYEFEACPFCVKVRRFLRGAGVEMVRRDAKQEPYKSELVAGGGKYQVPCLKITESDGSVKWMYESDDIIAFLRTRLGITA